MKLLIFLFVIFLPGDPELNHFCNLSISEAKSIEAFSDRQLVKISSLDVLKATESHKLFVDCDSSKKLIHGDVENRFGQVARFRAEKDSIFKFLEWQNIK